MSTSPRKKTAGETLVDKAKAKPRTRVAVKSNAIVSVGYFPDSHELDIEFPNGTVTTFLGVAAETHADLMAAPSVGRFYAANIRGKYAVKDPTDTP